LGQADVSRNQWIDSLSYFFEFHRTFSIAILAQKIATIGIR
jgi:hypothetical protein